MDELITIITNHGLSLAIAIIVLYGGIQIMNAYIAKLKKDLTNNDKEKNAFTERHNVSTQVNLLLNKLMYETNADRVGVYEFHNGEGNLSGMPFIKISNTYEICNENISSVQKDMLNLPISLFTKYVDKLITEDYVFMNLEDPEETDMGLVDDLQRQHGVTKSVGAIITDINHSNLGFIGIFDCDNEKNFTYNEIKKLRGVAKELGILLSLK